MTTATARPTLAWTAQHARALMAEHGLTTQGWRFAWDNARRRFGCCKHSTRTITLSKFLAPHRSADDIEQTVLHEIAHALVGPSHGHDATWLRQARAIGYRGGRCSDHSEESRAAVVAAAAWVGTCADCRVEIPRHRAPKPGAVYRHPPCARRSRRGVVTWARKR